MALTVRPTPRPYSASYCEWMTWNSLMAACEKVNGERAPPVCWPKKSLVEFAPSMLYSVDRLRAPFAVMEPSKDAAVTPGVRRAIDLKSRPMMGRLSICWFVTDVVDPERVVSTMGAAAVT